SKTKLMNKLILSVFILFAMYASGQVIEPNLSNKEHLKSLGVGKIIEKDHSILKNITLLEITEYWVVYLKNESIHDLSMESIKRIEFPESKWGYLSIEFPDNKTEIVWPIRIPIN